MRRYLLRRYPGIYDDTTISGEKDLIGSPSFSRRYSNASG
jgi:hypothetical protein